MEIKTERLILTEWSNKDIKELVKNLNNLEISKNLLSVSYPYTEKDALGWIKYSKDESIKLPRLNYNFAIKLKSNKLLLGEIALQIIDTNNNIGEVNFWLGQKHWRKYYMSEALKEIINFAFNNLKLNRLNYYIFSENIASKKLANKFGFRYIETEKESVHCKADGKDKDNDIYVLDRQGIFK